MSAHSTVGCSLPTQPLLIVQQKRRKADRTTAKTIIAAPQPPVNPLEPFSAGERIGRMDMPTTAEQPPKIRNASKTTLFKQATLAHIPPSPIPTCILSPP